MIKSILVPATGNDTDIEIFASALAVARPFGAHLDFLHVRLDAVSFAASVSPEIGSGQLIMDLIDKMEKEAARRELQARESFQRFCGHERLIVAQSPPAAATLSAAWLKESGSEPYWVVEYARAADLLVIGRPGEGAIPGSNILELALLNTGRPLLIPPPRAMVALPETVVIAWKATPEAARAVTAAMPLLSIAKQIIIATVAQNETAFHDNGAGRLLASLRWHGLPVSMRRLDPSLAPALA